MQPQPEGDLHLVTQPAPAYSPTVPPPPVAPALPTADPKPVVVTSEQLAQAILQQADLEPDEMEALRRTVKMPGWEVGKPAPAFPQSHVVDSMFVGDGDPTGDVVAGDVRVYARPTSFTDPSGEPSPFFRFVFNRTSQSSRTDVMSLQSFVEDVGAEYAAMVVEDEDDEEDEPLRCTNRDCGTELPDDARFCHRCSTPVRRCGNCLHVGELLDKYCAGCGMALPPPGMGR